MFTGIVAGRGRVTAIERNGSAIDLSVQLPAEAVTDDPIQIGESIANNGCCLTVIRSEGDVCTFQAGAETLSRTNLGRLKPGDVVNIERSLRASERLGGHFVQGHVDGAARVDAIDRDGEWIKMWFRVAPRLTAQMVAKGSVTVDGVSLTLVDVEAERFSIALIPHTLDVTTLGLRKVGDPVNIETDILGKYLEKMVGELQLSSVKAAAAGLSSSTQ
ncbi:Riboflavin synthase [Maioricimonas rarisocia]|uniref:Riboflavin synthase n=1 Tax=Maioricimonas rarisocia TaxID=2528026 RepID=A0A517Z713_9PLAN|nr:riboflavin synthase [Maioricimonas rarisocia]QDU38275.1 Riboflavin synthase [Maioricimonas rarisocia]